MRHSFLVAMATFLLVANLAIAGEKYVVVQNPRVVATLRFSVKALGLDEDPVLLNAGSGVDVRLCQVFRAEKGQLAGKIVVLASEEALGWDTLTLTAVFAHELAHVILGHVSGVGNSSAQEAEADALAAKAVGVKAVSRMQERVFSRPASGVAELQVRQARLQAVRQYQ